MVRKVLRKGELEHVVVKKKKKKNLAFSNVLIVLGVLLIVMSFGPLLVDEVWFYLKELKNQKYTLNINENGDSKGVKDSVFARFLSSSPVDLEPVNRDFAVVIERIGLNAPVVKNVPVTDEKAYLDALKSGVAHAFVSEKPSKNAGNVYLFAHASLNFWQLGKYASAFNLLRKLDPGDRTHIFYENKVFVYEMIHKEVVKGWNTYPITRPVIEPILTLQTCDPPGTTLNRLVVTSKLVDVYEE